MSPAPATDPQLPAETAAPSPFATEHLKADLKGRSLRGGAATFLGQGIKFTVQLGSTAVLARLLTPEHFGLIGMVTALTGFASLFKDLGLSAATVQRADISHQQISTLFWVNVTIGVLVAAVTAALGPVVAWFYGDPRLVPVTAALAVSFVFAGGTVQHQALLRRQMRFRALVCIDILAVSGGVATAVVGAALGATYWSLVMMNVAMAFYTAVGVWVACRWRPGPPVRRAGIRSMLCFGANLSSFGVMNYFARNLDHILIGRYWGTGPLAFYAKAYGLLMLPLHQINAPIASVAVPALSRLQDQPERYRRFYLRAINTIAFVTMPLVATMAILSKEMIGFVLGNQWVGASPIFMVLALAAFFQPIASTTGWVYVSLNRTRRMAIWGLISSPLTCVSFIIGLPWGPMGVAVSYTVFGYAMCYFMLVFCFKSSPISVRDVLSTLLRPTVLNLIMAGTMIAARFYVGNAHPLMLVVVCLVAEGAAAALAVVLWKALRADLKSTLDMAVAMFHVRSPELSGR